MRLAPSVYNANMKRLSMLLVAGLTMGSLILAWAQSTAQNLVINGKPVPGKTLVQKGVVYVPLSSLKSAGATTSSKGGTLSISFPGSATGEGGANQQGALEGGLNTWLFNGIWRFQVTSVAALDEGRPGWKVDVELRNGSKANGVALAGSGFQAVDLVMEDGNTLGVYNVSDLRDPAVAQGATIKVSLVYYDDEGNGRKPSKLVLRIAPDAETKSFLKRNGAAYSVPDPSFRVNLK